MKLSVENGNLGAFETIETGGRDNFATIITSTNYSLGQFKDGKRNLKNFERTEAIGLDFDDGMTLAEAKEAFKDYTHIIATTKSHGKEKNGKIADRFRVILKLVEPITDVETFEATWFDLARKFPACDKACKDASRFFYPSKTIESYKTDGIKVAPVAPPEREPWAPIETSVLPDWSKGRLAKRTRDFLEKGAEPGQKHHELYFSARDANQNGYTEEWFIDQMNKLSEKTGDDDYIDRGSQKTITDAFAKDPKHPPRVEAKAFKWQEIGQFMRDAKATSWLTQGLLAVGGVSVMAGPPKSGKSTLVRQLAKAVCRGDEFLGRKCKRGPVFHIALEEQEETLKDSYKAVGINDNDRLYLHVGGVYDSNFMQDLTTDLIEAKPSLLIVDTLFLLAPVESLNDYAQVNAAMTPFRRMARDTDTHIMFVHHTNKTSEGGPRSISGSQAIHGAVDCALILSQDGNKRRLQTSQRGGVPFQPTSLEFEAATQTYTIGRSLEEYE
jgi:hypothetical protein